MSMSAGEGRNFKVWDVGQRLGIDASRSREISDKMKILLVPKEANGAEL